MSNVFMAFLLTTLAGFSTLLGLGLIFVKTANKDKIVCCSLAFAAGVMICVSITDLVPESILMLRKNLQGPVIIFLSFLFVLIGVIMSMIIDKVLPTYEKIEYDNGLFKIGIISMIAIIIHNLPEGIATFISTTRDTSLGVSLTIAIALHNIPEGISIGIPIYYATKSKFKAFGYTFISALSESFGALITYLFLAPFINEIVLGLLFSFIAGIMLQIAFCELIPASKKYNYSFIYYISFGIGVLFMLMKFLL